MSIFFADRYFKRFEDVSIDILKSENVKLLLCDLDNTLKVRRDFEPEDSLIEWVKECKNSGIKIIVISNNGKKKKVGAFCKKIGVSCVTWAKKPLSTKLTETMQQNNFSKKETVMLGDKWSTDILAAKFAGVRGWKVEHRKGILSDDEKNTKKKDFKEFKVIKKEKKREEKSKK